MVTAFQERSRRNWPRVLDEAAGRAGPVLYDNDTYAGA